ncbi:endonuclease III domain-containing protein [Hominibacterium faecale]|uniref:endonuclease III domain-containing protein n=1 Tax=Hominibacterium faecale TaxID=2839743 RepID=UPI0022B29A69|nr:endonuclease III [Hominibacterium faecale]
MEASKQNRQEYVTEILSRLDERYGSEKETFDFPQPWQQLVGIILSAQTTDRQVNQVLPQLFGTYGTPAELGKADVGEVMEIIRPVGLHKTKGRNIIACCRRLEEEFGGAVPQSIQELLRLPGVGRKTATLCLADVYHIPGVTVDTHVFRIARRLGWARGKTPAAVEKELEAVLPRTHWNRINFQLVEHGRTICSARKADCKICPLTPWCEKIGVEKQHEERNP